jgi:hypothetical protein
MEGKLSFSIVMYVRVCLVTLQSCKTQSGEHWVNRVHGAQLTQTQCRYECRNWETEHYNSVSEITVSFLVIHKWNFPCSAGSQPTSTVQLCTWSPNIFWRSNSIFNVWGNPSKGERNENMMSDVLFTLLMHAQLIF